MNSLNYASQAEKGLKRTVFAFYKAAYNLSGSRMGKMREMIKDAVHFQLPENGNILSDQLNGLKGLPARLPFPLITASYHCDNLSEFHEDAPEYVPKRMIIATENVGIYFPELYMELRILNKDEVDNGITLFCINGTPEGDWVPDAFGWFMPHQWESRSDSIPVEPLTPKKPGSPRMVGLPILALPEIVQLRAKETGMSRAVKEMTHDIGQSVSALLEMCEALSCSNVKHEPIEHIDPAMNAKRIKDGKSPLYETRILVLDGEKKQFTSMSQQGNHKSPRQHLRRGHIRRLDTKNIWINSCVVGDSANGIIEKSYLIKG